MPYPTDDTEDRAKLRSKSVCFADQIYRSRQLSAVLFGFVQSKIGHNFQVWKEFQNEASFVLSLSVSNVSTDTPLSIVVQRSRSKDGGLASDVLRFDLNNFAHRFSEHRTFAISNIGHGDNAFTVDYGRSQFWYDISCLTECPNEPVLEPQEGQ